MDNKELLKDAEIELTKEEIELQRKEDRFKAFTPIVKDWLENVRGEDIEELMDSSQSRESIVAVAKKIKMGRVRIEDGFIYQKLIKPVGDLKELKFEDHYTAGQQSKANRNVTTEGPLASANNLIAAITGNLQGEIRKLHDKDISTAQEIESLYFL